MKLIYPYLKENLSRILPGILCMILVDIAQIVIPQILKIVIDQLAAVSESSLLKEPIDTRRLFIYCLVILALGLAMAVLRYGWRNLLMGSARNVENSLRNDLFKRILNLDMSYLDRVKTGDIMAHAVSDINHIRMAFGFGVIVLVDIILLGGATVVIMAATHPKLTALAVIPMPFLILVTRVLGKKMHLFHTDAQKSFSALTELVRESFAGIRIIKVYNFEKLTGEKVRTSSIGYFNKNLKRAFITALLKPVLGLFFNLSTLIIIFYGGFLVMQKDLTPGELAAFLQYLGILSWPVIAIGWLTNLFQRGMASLKRINSLMDTELDVRPPERPVPVPEISGNICFDGVSFRFDRNADAPPALENISLTVEKGRKIGITGPPGSGKTSLIQLIPRMYDPFKGKILLDNHDIKTMDLECLRSSIALMPQEAFLFSGTIRENILLGREADQNWLECIIRTCCLETTLQKMPKGLDTMVGERGITLSGGQKQRVALARTLMIRKPVIILDDPISQMDTDTAATVMSRLREMNLDAALIIVSHRIAALADCDRIHILKNGKIEASGTHDELIKTNDFYNISYQVQQSEKGSPNE